MDEGETRQVRTYITCKSAFVVLWNTDKKRVVLERQ